MSNATKYTVKVNGTEVATRSAKPAAEKIAADAVLEGKGAAHVQVVTGKGTVVIDARPTVTRFVPWTRVELPTKFEAPSIAGFTPAYQRVRISTVVYRSNDKAGWLVVDYRGETPVRHEAKTTTEAREITNSLMAGRKLAAAV